MGGRVGQALADSGSPSEPGERVSTHRALHRFMRPKHQAGSMASVRHDSLTAPPPLTI